MLKPKQVTLVLLPRSKVVEDILNSNELFAEYISTLLEDTGIVDVLAAYAEDFNLNPQPKGDSSGSNNQDQS